MKIGEKFTPASQAEWRTWLEEHGAARSEIWLVYFKKSTGKPSLTYREALEEALCFGWIDGVRRALDDQVVLHAVLAALGLHRDRHSRIPADVRDLLVGTKLADDDLVGIETHPDDRRVRTTITGDRGEVGETP